MAVVIVCSERDELASQLALMNVRLQQLTAREADAYQQVKACIELAEQSQIDMSQVRFHLTSQKYCRLLSLPSLLLVSAGGNFVPPTNWKVTLCDRSRVVVPPTNW